MDRVDALLASAGLAGPCAIQPLRGGTNNQVFRVEVSGRQVLLKAYYQDELETRDRLGVEQQFLRFAWDRGIRCVPEPLASDVEAKLGVYEFIDGPPYAPGDVTAQDVADALAFVCSLNAHRRDADALAMSDASDSCFSGDDYLRSIDRRLTALVEMQPVAVVEHEVSRFVRDELAPAWAEARAAFAAHARRIGWSLDARLSRAACCVSPSDFGFHNALASRDGVRFIDFEYAGWDDPAKLVCDFFGQFEIPVPMDLFDGFASAFSALFEDGPAIRARMAVVFPACRFKWLSIMLNDFHPAVRKRRSFAHADAASDERPARQLRKARAALQALATTASSF